MNKTIVRSFAPCLAALLLAATAHSGEVGRDADLLRTGWYPNQPGLSPQIVSGGSFGELFSTSVEGQVYAQPLVFAGTLLVATQSNWIYGLDPLTGAIRWSRNVGTPWNASDVTGCTDIEPVVGITCTPVIDDATGIAYFTSKSYAHGASGATVWKMHAVAVATGAEQAGFPVTIAGVADNDPAQTFSPSTQNQRPGLLLLNGVVYAAFGSVCDIGSFQGWVIGVSTAGAVTARWVDRSATSSGNGIWMSGSGLVSDGAGQILLVTGNGMGGGTPSTPIAGSSPPAELGESVVRLSVQPDGSLEPVDFFTPWNASTDYDLYDIDVGSGGVIGLPSPYFGTATHPKLFVQVGKPGIMYLLDADSLGGCQQGAGGTDQVVQELSSDGGVWSKPAVWGGDGGWLYVPTATVNLDAEGSYGYLRAYKAGVDGSGKPTLTLAGSTPDPFGFTSSSPIVTSVGTTSGSALLWIVWNPDRTGNGSELRAYDVLPVDGELHLRFSSPVGLGPKFNPPGVDNGRLYVGTRDGQVICFGLPTTDASGPALPRRAALSVAYPNPAARTTALDLELASGGSVTLTVFDPGGRQVRRLVAGELGAGSRRVVWDGRDDAGAIVPAGLYLVRMDAAGVRESRRVMIVR